VDPLGNAENGKLVSGGKLNLQQSMQLMANTLNRAECSDNILVSNEYIASATPSDLALNVYPNPFKEGLQVDMLTKEPKLSTASVRLVAIDGQIVWQQIIDINNNKSSVYIETGD